MATMKCKACSKVYNYRSSELCPKCGAYNRPPHSMRVEFDNDGGVVLSADKGSPRTAYTTTETKDAYTRQARKVRDALLDNDIVDKKTLDALGEQLNKWGGRLEKWWTENSEKSRHVASNSPLRDRKRGKSSGSKAVAIIAALSILISLIGTITESCQSNLVHIAPEPDYSIATEEVAPADRYWSAEERKMRLDAYAVSEEVGLTEVFEWNDAKYWVGDWQLTGGGAGDNFMIISVNGNEFPEERLEDCYLLWVDWDGMEWVYNPEKFQNGAMIFRYLHTTSMPEDTLCWVMFNDYDDNGNWSGTTAVSLVEHDTYFSNASQDLASTEEVVVWSEEDCKNLLSLYGVTEVVSMGTVFDWEGVNLWVDGWTMDGMDNATMVLSLNSNQPLSATSLERCFLVWAQDPNISWTHHPESYQDGKMFFTDFYDPLHEGIKLWLVCEHYDMYGNRANATAVELH